MTTHPSIKILVVLFSFCLGGLLTWQLTKNLSAPNEAEPEQQESAPEEKNDTYVHPIGPKSVGGSLDVRGIFPVTPATPDPEERKQDTKEEKILLPSSKSGFVLPPQK